MHNLKKNLEFSCKKVEAPIHPQIPIKSVLTMHNDKYKNAKVKKKN